MRWYFDFISPFAYLQSYRLKELAAHGKIEATPLLFAGLLNHWGHTGPAEIPTKRQWTFEHCVWIANRDGIPLNLPPEHPFNPIPLLRLCIAAGNTIEVVARLFQYVWVDGKLPNDSDAFNALCSEFNLTPEVINADEIKAQLRKNGDDAIADGVFGVPTIEHQGRIFWGYDATDMAIAWLDHLDNGQSNDAKSDRKKDWPAQKLEAVLSLPEGLQRKT